MDVVRRTREGMAQRNSEEGVKAVGRHARTIRLGKALWQSPPLTAAVMAGMAERRFDNGTFPAPAQIKAALARAKQADEQRPAPFVGTTKPYVHLSIIQYGKRLHAWLEAVTAEDEASTAEQFSVLEKVSSRVLLEFELENKRTSSVGG